METNFDNSILSYDIKGLIKATGRKRSSIYKDIRAGLLRIRKAGRSTVILRDDAVKWLQALPPGQTPKFSAQES